MALPANGLGWGDHEEVSPMSTHEQRFPQLHIYARTQEAKRAERAKHQGPVELGPEVQAMSAHPGVRAVTPSQAAYVRKPAQQATRAAPERAMDPPVRARGRRRHPWNATWSLDAIDRPVLAGAQESYESEHATANPFRGKNDPSLLFTRHYRKMAGAASDGALPSAR